MDKVYLTARDKNADGMRTIKAEYSHNRETVRVPTGQRVHEKYWDKESKLIKANGAANVSEANGKLKKILATLTKQVEDLYIANGNVWPTKAQVDAYRAAQAAPAAVEAMPTPVTTAIAAYIKAGKGRKGKWQPLTKKTFEAVLNLIDAYEVATGITWKMETLTNAQVGEWQEWIMARVNPKTGKTYKNSTLGKQVKKLKQFLNDAPNGTLNLALNIDKVKAQHEMKVQSTIITLTAKEIKQLHALTIDNDCMTRTKDLFLLECFTGMRFCDAIKIGRADIHNGFIHFQAQKTVDALTIPLFQQTKEILEKYDFDLTPLAISNQKFNDNLKKLFAHPATLAAIPTLTNEIKLHEERGTVRSYEVVKRYEAIRSHAGRKSFITMALALKQSVHTVKHWSGHKSDASFSRYVNAAQGQVEAANALQAEINAL